MESPVLRMFAKWRIAAGFNFMLRIKMYGDVVYKKC